MWAALPINSSSSDPLLVSNDCTTIPVEQLSAYDDFIEVPVRGSQDLSTDSPSHSTEAITGEEDIILLKDIDEALKNEDYYYEGFDGPRRDCCSFHDVSLAPMPLQALHKRFNSISGLHANEIKVEEYIPQISKVDGKSQDYSLVYKFWIHPGKDYTQSEIEDSFIAELVYVPTVGNPGPNDQCTLFQAWNKPLDGQLMAWKLNAENDWTDVKFPTGACIVQRGSILKEWRSTRFLSVPVSSQCKHPPRIRVIRFIRLPDPDRPCVRPTDAYFGYVPANPIGDRREVRTSTPMGPLKGILTIVVTTSPTPSNPSTELLETAMATFLHGGEEFAYECPKVIMCDGVREGESVSRKHATTKQAMRSGIVTSDQKDKYTKYKANIRRLAESAEPRSIFANSTVVELEERHGFGFSLRHAIRHHVTTPYVCVVQHDRTFLRNTPVLETVKTMWNHAHIKYVGFNMKSNLTYRDIFQTKYGNNKRDQQTFDDMILRVSELLLPGDIYGPGGIKIESLKRAKQQRRMLSWANAYAESSHGRHIIQKAAVNEQNGAYCQLSLIPTLFWFDNSHICETSHYRDFVFNDVFRQVARGGFVEDKVSPVLKKTCERLGLRDGFSRYGCYILDDHSGAAFTGHLDGGTFSSHSMNNETNETNEEVVPNI